MKARLLTAAALAALLLLAVAGCGNKGDLVLPDAPEPAPAEAPPAQ